MWSVIVVKRLPADIHMSKLQILTVPIVFRLKFMVIIRTDYFKPKREFLDDTINQSSG